MAAEVRLRAATPGRTVAPEDIYAPQGDPPVPCDADRCWGQRAIGWRPASSCGAGGVVGLIDTAVDPSAPALAGRLLAAAVTRVLARGVPVVAAAGNDGPEAPPAYPAAYPGVLAVAAVDRGLRPYRKANRGAYIAFAAPGVDLVMGHASYSGTSYAAAFVTAVVAGVVARDQALDPASVELRLAASALDLGAPGRDPVFGWGSVRSPDGCVTPS